MADTALLKLDAKEITLPVIVGTEGERAIDTRKLRAETGYICFDQGYGNTGSCDSAITYLDGDNGIHGGLHGVRRYRTGYGARQ